MNEPSVGLRNAAIHAENAGAEVPLSGVWHALVDGREQVRDAFFTGERCYLVLAATRGKVCALTGRRLFVLETLLSGTSSKALALDLGVAPSTISQDAKLGLAQLGFDHTAGRVHPLLVMLARAALNESWQLTGSTASFAHGSELYRVVGARRPDERLGPILPPAELAVVRGLVEGRNYKEIARSRGTSTRTVANQLAAVFRRLGVSGRCHLLEHLTATTDARG